MTPQPVAECRDVAVVARLAPDKGVGIAVEAFDAATQGRPAGRRLLIAGDGSERPRLEARYSGPRLRERVEFLGRLDEAAVSTLLGKVRVVVVASQPRHRPEGSSLATAEAAMHGRAVIASSDPAVREVAEELGVALVVPGWEVDGFAADLARLLDDDDLTAELGERGRANAARLHSIEAVVAATREVYDAARAAQAA
jgi:glycosyltransferase involved in cell wall biosynthesis